jgi:hypothetical protein
MSEAPQGGQDSRFGEDPQASPGQSALGEATHEQGTGQQAPAGRYTASASDGGVASNPVRFTIG